MEVFSFVCYYGDMPVHHAIHKRKAKRKKPVDKIDRIVYFFAFGAPFFEIPQLYTIYSQHTAANVSLVTWGFFAIASFAWLIYAVHHHLKPLIVSYVLFFTVELLIAIGILIYR